FQFSQEIEKKFPLSEKKHFHWMGPGLKNKLKIMKFIFEKEVWFSNNNIMIYLFIVLSFSRCHIILHDHKLRTNPSFKEVLILFLFHCFAWRF
ncbi:hypothetical protein CGH70_23735, partial [Vibrio parahaemolyticus]